MINQNQMTNQKFFEPVYIGTLQNTLSTFSKYKWVLLKHCEETKWKRYYISRKKKEKLNIKVISSLREDKNRKKIERKWIEGKSKLESRSKQKESELEQ